MLCLWIRKLFPMKLSQEYFFFSATLFPDVKNDIFIKPFDRFIKKFHM